MLPQAHERFLCHEIGDRVATAQREFGRSRTIVRQLRRRTARSLRGLAQRLEAPAQRRLRPGPA